MVKRRPEWFFGRKTRFSKSALGIFAMKNQFFVKHTLTRNVLLRHGISEKTENLAYMSLLGRKRPSKMAYFQFSGRVFTMKNLFFFKDILSRPTSP